MRRTRAQVSRTSVAALTLSSSIQQLFIGIRGDSPTAQSKIIVVGYKYGQRMNYASFFFPPRATRAALRSLSLYTRTPPLERLMSKFFANSRASCCTEFFSPFILIPFFGAISPPGKKESSADRQQCCTTSPRDNQVSALHEMKHPTTAGVSLPVDANQKREVWQPLPCAQQSHN